MVNEPDTLVLVSSILRAEKMEERFIRKALDILKNADYTPEEKKNMAKEESVVPKIAESMSAEQVLRIDQMLEKVTDSMAKSTLEPVVTEVSQSLSPCLVVVYLLFPGGRAGFGEKRSREGRDRMSEQGLGGGSGEGTRAGHDFGR